MTKMGQKLTREQKFQKKIEYLRKQRKSSKRGITRIKKAIQSLHPIKFTKLITKLDKLYTEYMRRKSKGICIKCGKIKVKAGVSHYYGRRYLATRWSDENCDWACWGCHGMGQHCLEHNKAPGDWYHGFMVKKLGEDGFERLGILAHSRTHFSRMDIELLINEYGRRNKDIPSKT